MKRSKKSWGFIFLLFGMVVYLSQCINQTEVSNDPRGESFAAAGSCRQCHQAIYDSALLSAHFNASAMATKKNVLGSFNAGHNSFVYDSLSKIVMENRDSGMFQVFYVNGKEKEAHRFDITFGLRKAQTWLYWKGNNTYELPLSYYHSVNGWATSPGFPIKQPLFSRLIGKECFECHSSYIKNKENANIPTGGYFGSDEVIETMEKESLIVGIDCQRCHGPLTNHVNYHLAYPEIKTAKYIVSNKSLSQQQQLDRCAVCHSGNDKVKLKSRFYFLPGDTLLNFYLNLRAKDKTTDFDVHGNQYGLMSESQCFLQSKKMNCTTCHDPHKNATESLAYFSQKCMSCHNEANHNLCSKITSLGNALKDNCIDCHMPKKSSGIISFQLEGSSQTSSYLLRTHRIAVYAENIKK
jgi:hypothetical protein